MDPARAPEQVDWALQYTLGWAPTALPPGFGRHSVGGLTVGIGPRLPHLEVRDGAGGPRGLVLGWMVDPTAGRLETGPLQVDGGWGAVEEVLYRHGGSWMAVVTGPADGRADHAVRAYLDADGTLPLVFRPEHRAAASSAGLLLDRAEYRSDHDGALARHLQVRREGWYPSGLTAHRSVRRLLCNHFLDLDSWQATRHWPVGPVPVTADPERTTEELMDLAAGVVRAIASAHDPVLSLTAGNETRFLLAACRPFVHELPFFTLVPERGRSVDVDLARALADRFDLRHRLVDHRTATPAEQEEWLFLGGHCVGGPNVRDHPSLRALAPHDVLVGGLGGEIGRAFFWRTSDRPTTPIDAATICARFGMPASDQVLAATERWLAGVPAGDAYFQLDLAYLELRMSAWGYANPFGSGKEIVHLAPLVGRPQYERLLSLPPEWKRRTGFVHHAVARGWPELGELPINRYGDRRDLWRAMARVAREPHLVVKKLRKRLR